MSTPIPGSNVIGWGFNIFGTYSSASRTQQLFAMRDEGKYWSYGPTDYLVPENLSVEATSESTGQSYVFENRTEVEQFFSVKANVKGSYGAFSGEFEASYEQRNVSDTDYIYAMYQLSHHSWRLDLLDRTQAALAPWVVGDPDWQVPATFDQSTASRFYRFFEKYGTHFVSSVQVGYRLYFSQAVKRSYESNEQTIKSKIDLEYKALFVDTRAECTATWNQLGQDWTNETTVNVSALGGDSSILDTLQPTFHDNYNTVMTSWRKAADAAPVAVDFSLSPMWNLFSGAQADALHQAYDSYLHDRVYVESKSDSCAILVLGKPETPAAPAPSNTAGFQISILERDTLEPVLNEYLPMSLDAWWLDIDAYYNRALTVVSPYTSSQYLAAIATYGMVGMFYPRGGFYQFLLSVGAGDCLKSWQSTGMANTKSDVGVNYALVGVPQRGPGTGLEAVTIGDKPAQWTFTPSLNAVTRLAIECSAATLDVLIERLRSSTLGTSVEPRLVRSTSQPTQR